MRDQLRRLDRLERADEPRPALRGLLLHTLAEALRGQRRFEAAGAAYREAIAVRRRSGTSAPEIATWLCNYGGMLHDERRLLEAEATLREDRGIEDSFTQQTLASLIALYRAWDRPADVRRFSALVVDEPTTSRYH